MIGDVTIRNLSPATQPSYVYAVSKFGRLESAASQMRWNDRFHGVELLCRISTRINLLARQSGVTQPPMDSFLFPPIRAEEATISLHFRCQRGVSPRPRRQKIAAAQLFVRRSRSSTEGKIRLTMTATPAAVGCIPSGWLTFGSPATPSRKNGSRIAPEALASAG